MYSRKSFIYKYKTSTLTPFVKPRNVLNLAIQNLFYVQSNVEYGFTYNLGSTILKLDDAKFSGFGYLTCCGQYVKKSCACSARMWDWRHLLESVQKCFKSYLSTTKPWSKFTECCFQMLILNIDISNDLFLSNTNCFY